jgi:hypothetical protein
MKATKTMSQTITQSITYPSFTLTTSSYLQETSDTLFSISRLPYEIRLLIYTYYLSSLSPVPITSSTSALPSCPLALASPFFKQDLTISLILKYTTFAFSSVHIFQGFAQRYPRLGKVRVLEKGWSWEGDWVFLVLSQCRGVSELTFVGGMLEVESVVDAVREGVPLGKKVVLRIEKKSARL